LLTAHRVRLPDDEEVQRSTGGLRQGADSGDL
jgi:hypothetical protein